MASETGAAVMGAADTPGKSGETLGEAVRKLRLGHGLTQLALAHVSRISLGTLNAIEAGTHKTLNVDTLIRLADGLQVEPGYLCNLIWGAARTPPMRKGRRRVDRERYSG